MIGIRSKRILSDAAIYIILLVMVVIWLFPLVWMILRSFDVRTGVSSAVIPEEFTLDNYKNLFPGGPYGDYEYYPYLSWIGNTFIIAIISCVISTLFVLMVAYALSRLRFSVRKKLMNISLILGLFPGFMAMMVLYYVFKAFGLAGNQDSSFLNLLGLALAYSLASGTGYYIVKGFFDTVPFAIDEAARIDGATKNRIFWQMIIPLSKPIIIYTILTTFISPWCDFIMASLFMGRNNAATWTVAVGIREWLAGANGELIPTHFTRFCAGGILVSIPIVILFLIMQKFYVEGITGGAAKG